MELLRPGAAVAEIPGASLGTDPGAVVFYKVTCPTCQMAAPPMERLFRATGDRFAAVVQDPPDRAAEFARAYDTSFPSIPDEEPYEVSKAWGVRVVPTLFVTADGHVEDVVESWDREGWARAAARLGELLGSPVPPPSEEGDGLPPFRPG
jgi:hypothetical protein